jgi:hypothetical protein
MIEAGNGQRFGLQPFPRRRGAECLAGQHLDRDIPLQPRITRALDGTHPSGTDPFVDGIVGERAADEVVRPVHGNLIIARTHEGAEETAILGAARAHSYPGLGSPRSQ